MRDYIFRGKRVDNGEWVEGDLRTTNGMSPYQTNIVTYTNERYNPVVPESVGQYTGMKDKNGRKIFEGDILEFADRLVSVFWHAHLGCWDSNFLKYTNQNNDRDDMSPCRWEYRAEVVGTVFENADLLEG